MKTILLLLSLMVNTARAVDVSVARTMFLDSYSDSKSAAQFYSYLHTGGLHSNPVLKGYTGVSEIMMCRHLPNPLSKLKYFRSGRKLLEAAIIEDRGNTELRFLRFAIQTNAPRMLDYSVNIREDKQVLWSYLQVRHENKAGLYKMIREYLLGSSYINEQEKLFIKNFCK